MQSWYIAGNSLPEFRSGHVTVVARPWWLSLVGWFIDQLEWLCCSHCNLLVRIPFPPFFPNRKFDDGDEYTWNDYYGDLGGFLWCHVYDPAMMWFWKHNQKYERHIEIGYDKMKAIFGKDHVEYFARMEKDDE